MSSEVRNILGIIPVAQSVALLKETNPFGKRKRKRGLIRSAAGILVGAPLIKATSDSISSI